MKKPQNNVYPTMYCAIRRCEDWTPAGAGTERMWMPIMMDWTWPQSLTALLTRFRPAESSSCLPLDLSMLQEASCKLQAPGLPGHAVAESRSPNRR